MALAPGVGDERCDDPLTHTVDRSRWCQRWNERGPDGQSSSALRSSDDALPDQRRQPGGHRRHHEHQRQSFPTRY